MTLEQTFKDNQNRIRKAIKEQQKKYTIQKIIACFIALAIILGTMKIIGNMSTQAMNDCTKTHSYNYCAKNI